MGVRLISKSRLVEFWEARKHDSDIAERDLSAWLKILKAVDWGNFAALKQTFGSADQVGNCVVFDVGNNRFRLIGRVNYRFGIVYVLKVMDHAEYDKRSWVDDCHCHEPPPEQPKTPRKKAPVGREPSSVRMRPKSRRKRGRS